MKRILSFIDNTLKSVKFSIFLMLLIAIASIYGTIFPARGPFDFNLYKTPYFIALLFLFALNTTYCTFFRVFRQLKVKYIKGISGKKIFYVKADIQDVKDKIIKKGYRTEDRDDGFFARRGKARYIAILTIHFSIIIILIAGGLSNLTSFLGTVNIHVGNETDTVFDWDKKEDVRIPFIIKPENLFIDYYPMDIKVLIENIKTGETREFVTKEKEVIKFSEKLIRIEKADPLSASVFFKINNNVDIYKNESPTDGIKVKLRAYIDPVVKQYYCDLSVKINGEVIKKRISINDPFIYNNYRIYLIETGKDQFGFDYAGFQISRDIFQWLLWLGSILLCISLSFYPFLKDGSIMVIKRENFLEITL
ncbi:MAG: cytochrome c biogenesis protein ResB [Proteobacteria bacterium]|nr:cytochrome c biogenesis protein ResB [Pseudomonadota bacterium]